MSLNNQNAPSLIDLFHILERLESQIEGVNRVYACISFSGTLLLEVRWAHGLHVKRVFSEFELTSVVSPFIIEDEFIRYANESYRQFNKELKK